MSIMRSLHTLLTLGIISIISIGFLIPTTLSTPISHPEDGIWEDSFEDNSNLKMTNCHNESGEILLNRTGSQENTYDFDKQSSHEAYAFQSFFFFPRLKYFAPKNLIGREAKFGGNDIYRIKALDQNYAVRISKNILFSHVMNHYRFKIDFDPKDISFVTLRWYGKANANTAVHFYYYNASYMLTGGWVSLKDPVTSDGSDFEYVKSISSGDLKYAMSDDNYLDILVVTSQLLTRNSLSTNYVKIDAKTTTGFTLEKATAETKTSIIPTGISITKFYWESLTWDDYQPTGTEARYHVLYVNDTGEDIEVEDSVLPGNNKGFLTAPVSLNNLSNDKYGLKYTELKIRVNLSTSSPAVSPRIFNWALTWQNKSYWLDSFTTYYRIDTRSKVTEKDGAIMLSTLQDEWPMFGFNAANTRASGGTGATSNNLYWFSAENVGGKFRNPVIANGNVFIASKTHTLYKYSMILPNNAEEGEPVTNSVSVILPKNNNVVNSPAVTDDLIVIATGERGSGGTNNYIYAYEPNNLSYQWTFDNNGEKICYETSPVIDGSLIFITSWGGDNRTYALNPYTNNKLLVIDLNGNLVDTYPLHAQSFSSPAITTEKIIITCASTKNDSVIALNRASDGRPEELSWSKAVGAVGHASPVIYEDTVFVTCAQVVDKKYATKVVALNLNDGSFIWNMTLGDPVKPSNVADCTPAVSNGVLYATSADGKVYALDTTNGTTIWKKEIYSIPLFSETIMLSSPAYADNLVYIGTPEGDIQALDASSGNPSWTFTTFVNWTAAPVFGSPVVSNGLVFVADENGVLYSLGKFTTTVKQVSGRIISIPIRLPEALWWGTFYTNYNVKKDVSSITFKLLDENGNVLNENLLNRSSLTSSGFLGRTVRLQADFASSNLSNSNPTLYNWYITLTTDDDEPFLNTSTFTPAVGGWLQVIVPEFTIKVKDNGTGLLISTASYTLTYTVNNVSTPTSASESAKCTGLNGTTDWQTMTMDISLLPDYRNISSLKSLSFNITDLAGNVASKTITFKQDVIKPTSNVLATNMKSRYNSSFIRINATATDVGVLGVNASGVKLVELFYRYSESKNFSGKDWVYFANSTKTSPTWLFNFTDRPSQSGGYFELCTIATDVAGNTESFPTTGDVMFLYDWKAPLPPSISGDTLWFKERPQFSAIFEDDYRLDTIQYRPNFDTIWTTLASHVNESVYNTDSVGNAWFLSETDWNQMEEGQLYSIYIRVNDTLNNTMEILGGPDVINIMKDTAPPAVSIDVPSVQDEWSTKENFTISGLGNDHQGSGIKEAVLYYRYSVDNSNWSAWTTYGNVQDVSPFEWNFNAVDGDGYYEMKIMVTDNAGNEVESEVFPIAVASFPMMLALVLVGLLTVLVLLSIIIYLAWRKKETA